MVKLLFLVLLMPCLLELLARILTHGHDTMIEDDRLAEGGKFNTNDYKYKL